ncbi:MAG: GH32 C-terminal domain-containing protein [Tyzzerella sp.]|nr:GH32 C-terminal domain-containing protein [Tyzzerella sp.]
MNEDNKKKKATLVILLLLLLLGIVIGLFSCISKDENTGNDIPVENVDKDTSEEDDEDVSAEQDDGIYEVQILKSAHGSVTANKTEAAEGDEIVLTVKPDDGYELKSLTVNKKKSETTFKMPAKDVKVLAKFSLIVGKGNFFGKSGDYESSDVINFKTDKGLFPYLTLDATKGTPLYAYINDLSAKQFYFETEVEVTDILKSEKYPKFGIMTNDGTEMVKFYLDMSTKKVVSSVGAVHQVSGGDDDWANQDYFSLDEKLNLSKKTVKLGLLRDGKTYYFYVNGELAATGSDLSNKAGAAGVFSFGTSLKLTNYKLVTSGTKFDKLLNEAKEDVAEFNKFSLTTNYFAESSDGVYKLKTNSADESKVDDVKYAGQVLKTPYYSIKGKLTLKNSKDWSQARILISSDPKNEYVIALEQTAKNKYQIFTMSKNNEEIWNNWTSIVGAEINGDRNSIDFEVIANGNKVYFLIDDMICYTSDSVSMTESTVKFAGYKNATTIVEDLDGQIFSKAEDVEKYLATKDAESFWVYGLTTNYFEEKKDGVYTLTTKSKDESKVDDVIYGGTILKESHYSIKGKLTLTDAEDWSQARILISSDPKNEHVIALEQTAENKYQIFTMSKDNEQVWNEWKLIAHAEASSSKNSVDFEVVADGNKIYFLVDDEICYTSDRVSMKESTVKFASYNNGTTTVENLDGQLFKSSEAVQFYLATKSEKAYESPFQDRIDAMYQEYFVDNNCTGKGGTLLLGHSHMDRAFWNEWESQTGLTNYVNGYNVGIGGTTTMDWLYAYDTLVKPFGADRFVISLGENDVTGWGATGEEVVGRLAELFEKIHNDHSEAEIYYIYSLPAQTKYKDGKWLNSKYAALVKGEKELVDSLRYVEGISMFDLLVDADTDEVKTELYRPNKDIHLNADGYKVWSDHLYDLLFKGENFGVTKVGDTYYKTTNGIELRNDKGETPTVDIFGGAPRYAYLNDTFTDKLYFETEITVSEVLNGDKYPKFGLILNGETESLKFYVDMTAEMTATKVGVVHQPTNGADDWANSVSANVDNMKFTNEDKIKLAVARDGKAYYFYVNDELVLVEDYAFTDEKSAVGIFSFNTVLTASNYTVYTGTEAESYIATAKEDAKFRLTTNYFKETSEDVYTLTAESKNEGKVDDVIRGKQVVKAPYYSMKGTISLSANTNWSQARILVSSDPQNEYVVALERYSENMYHIFSMSKNDENIWNDWQMVSPVEINGSKDYMDFEVIVIGNEMYFLMDDQICYSNDRVESMTESTVKFSCFINNEGSNMSATTTVKNLDGQIFETQKEIEEYLATKSEKPYESIFQAQIDARYQEYFVDRDCTAQGGTLILGHSHMDPYVFWLDWENQTGLTKYVNGYNVGIGGTTTADWLYAYDTLVKPFEADRFVISVGENDVRAWGRDGDEVVENLKELFEKIHTDRPDAEIYYIYSLPAAVKYVDGQWLDPEYEALVQGEKALCESLDYVQGIDTFDLLVDSNTKNVKTELFGANNDIHLNQEGYKVWSAYLYDKIFKGENFGVTVGDGVTYKTTNGIELIKDEGKNATIEMFGGVPRYAYLNDTFTNKFYFETEINVSEVLNNDGYPKFGLMLNGKTEMVKFYVDMTPQMTANTVGVVYQPTGQSDDWGNAVSANVNGMKFTGSDKVKLAVVRDGMDYYFYVNGELVLWETCGLEDEKSAVGIFSFNTVLTASDYKILKGKNANDKIEQAKEDVAEKVKIGLTTNNFKETSSGVYQLTNSGNTDMLDSVTYNGSEMRASNYSVKGTLTLESTADWAQARFYISSDSTHEHMLFFERTNPELKTFRLNGWWNNGAGWAPWDPWSGAAGVLIQSYSVSADTYAKSIDFEIIVTESKLYFVLDGKICYVSDDVAMADSTVKFSCLNSATTTVENLNGQIFKSAENAQKYVEQFKHEFKTNLDKLTGINGVWNETARGLYSIGRGDNFAMSQTIASDFVYETDVTFEKPWWCAALVFRSQDNPKDGSYVVNIARHDGSVRLFKFPEGLDVGTATKTVTPKDNYHLRVEAIGNNLKLYVDGELIIDATDNTYASGKLGLLTCETAATYQNVMYEEVGTRLTENHFAQTQHGAYTFTNDGNVDAERKVDSVVYEGNVLKESNYSVKGKLTLNAQADWAQTRLYVSSDSSNEHLIYLERCGDNQYQLIAALKDGSNTWSNFVTLDKTSVQNNTYSVDFEVIAIGNKVYFLLDDKICYMSDTVSMTESSILFSSHGGATTTVESLDAQIFENATEAEAYVAKFESAFNTNLVELNGLQGTWVETAKGLYSNGAFDNFALSQTMASDFVYETDITFGQAQGAASVVFRSTDNPSQGSYVANIDRGTGQVRLFRFPGGVDVGTAYTEIKDTYHLRVEAIGNSLKCYVDGKLMVAGTDDTFTSGKLGLLTFNTTVTYQDVMYKEVTIDDIPTLNNLKVSGTDIIFAPKYDKSVPVYDVYMPSNTSKMNVSATADEEISITYALKAANGVIYDKGTLTSGENKELTPAYGESQMIINMTKDDDMSSIVLVITNKADAKYMSTEEYRPQLHFTAENNWLNDPNGLVYDTSNETWHMFYQYLPQLTNGYAKIWGHAVSDDLVNWVELPVAIDVDEFGAIWSGSCAVDENNTSGFFTDNKEGESKLVAMYTYCNDPFMQGVAYSKDHGVTWVKHRDANGLPAISTDYGEAGLRDPKIFKVPGDEKDLWYMVVAGGRGRIFVSENLREWTLIQELTYADGSELHSECPDLYPLEVLDKDGNETGETKWVYAAASKFYVIGDMVKGSDGYYRFKAEKRIEAPIAAGNMDAYATAYAAQSFYNDPSGRRISVHWLWDETAPNVIPTKRWNGILSLPLETTLKKTDSGYMIVQNPVDEVKSLRGEALLTKSNVTVAEDSANILNGLTGQIYEIEAIFSNFAEASEFGFELRTGNGQKTIYKYDVQKKKVILDKRLSGIWDNDISSWSLEPRSDGTVKLRVIVDKGAIETFGNDGDAHLVDLLFADESSVGMSFYTKGGSVTIDELTVYDMKSIYTQESVTKYVETYISLQTKENVEVGTEFTISAEIYPMTGAALFEWTIPEGLEVVGEKTRNSVTLKGTKKGSYTVSYTVNGKTEETTINIFTEKFSTNLTGWSAVSGNWAITDDGLKTSNLERGDDWYVSEVSVPSNKSWIYEADLNVTSVGAGGLVVGIKDPANVSAHWICLNTQPELNQFKLFKVGSDAWSEVTMPYTNYPTLTNPGKCHIRFEYDANSSTLTYKVAPHGTEDYVIVETQHDASLAAYDGSFYFGLNTFWSETIFNNVELQVLE